MTLCSFGPLVSTFGQNTQFWGHLAPVRTPTAIGSVRGDGDHLALFWGAIRIRHRFFFKRTGVC